MTKIEFTDKVNKVREDVNWTQVAYDLSKSHRTIQRYINGQRDDRPETMEAIIKAVKDQLYRDGRHKIQLANLI